MIDDVIMPEDRAAISQNELDVLLGELSDLQQDLNDYRIELYRVRGRYQSLVEAVYGPTALAEGVQMVDPVTQVASLHNLIAELERRQHRFTEAEKLQMREVVMGVLYQSATSWSKEDAEVVQEGIESEAFEFVAKEILAHIVKVRAMRENS